MKIAVIIGVIHMMMGIFVKGMNAVYFKQPMVLFFEVFTGIIILFGLFGWMDYLIFVKWLYTMDPYDADDAVNQQRIRTTPSIITIMINNFLEMGV
jgi:V-type H+-transporting ATPase subunit a